MNNLPDAQEHPDRPTMPPFLAQFAERYLGRPVAVHTGKSLYVGRLVSVTAICITLDAHSDILEGPVLTSIDASSVEAVEVLIR